MIDKSGEYWHLYFHEACADDPAQILDLVERLYSEVAEMGDEWHVRLRPKILKWIDWSTDRKMATVACRFSTPRPIKKEFPEFAGFGLEA